jgi:hypothetical protein
VEFGTEIDHAYVHFLYATLSLVNNHEHGGDVKFEVMSDNFIANKSLLFKKKILLLLIQFTFCTTTTTLPPPLLLPFLYCHHYCCSTTTTTTFNSIQFSSLLLVCCINSQKANYRCSTRDNKIAI